MRRATAMMDLSDGLAEDLPRLCRESGVGARVWLDRVPVASCARVLAAEFGLPAEAFAVSGGEDYELLFTCPLPAVEEIRDTLAHAWGTPAHAIGEITGENGIIFVEADGRARPVDGGFDHFAVGG